MDDETLDGVNGQLKKIRIIEMAKQLYDVKCHHSSFQLQRKRYGWKCGFSIFNLIF